MADLAHDSSVTQSVPAVAVTRPLVAALMAEIFWPGETVTYSIQLAGRTGQPRFVAVADAGRVIDVIMTGRVGDDTESCRSARPNALVMATVRHTQ
jgi:hypothetical protein